VKRIPKLSVLFDAVASNYWRQKHGFTGTVPFSLVTASKTFLSHIGIPETGSDKLGWMSMVLRAVINWVVVHDCFDCAKSALLERGIGDTIVDSSQQGLQLSFSAAGSFVQIWYNYQTFDWRVQLTSTRPKGTRNVCTFNYVNLFDYYRQDD
jgi:hypothetical protein